MERSFDPADFDRRLEALLKRTLEQEKQIKAMSVGVRGAEAGPVRDAREVLAEAAAILLALPKFPDHLRFRTLPKFRWEIQDDKTSEDHGDPHPL
ncbi:MAG: hypothetical protein JNK87_24465 [Bryobacterales bacterium]|nr:hypothetical protein [Bryobacterales bacterium]